jgi:hypothetical protein
MYVEQDFRLHLANPGFEIFVARQDWPLLSERYRRPKCEKDDRRYHARGEFSQEMSSHLSPLFVLPRRWRRSRREAGPQDAPKPGPRVTSRIAFVLEMVSLGDSKVLKENIISAEESLRKAQARFPERLRAH